MKTGPALKLIDPLPRCANCDVEIEGASVRSDHLVYCCPGCANGGPCICPWEPEQHPATREVEAPAGPPAQSQSRPVPGAPPDPRPGILIRVHSPDATPGWVLRYGLELEQLPVVDAVMLEEVAVDRAMFRIQASPEEVLLSEILAIRAFPADRMKLSQEGIVEVTLLSAGGAEGHKVPPYAPASGLRTEAPARTGRPAERPEALGDRDARVEAPVPPVTPAPPEPVRTEGRLHLVPAGDEARSGPAHTATPGVESPGGSPERSIANELLAVQELVSRLSTILTSLSGVGAPPPETAQPRQSEASELLAALRQLSGSLPPTQAVARPEPAAEPQTAGFREVPAPAVVPRGYDPRLAAETETAEFQEPGAEPRPAPGYEPREMAAPVAGSIAEGLVERINLSIGPFAQFSVVNDFLAALNKLPVIKAARPRRFRRGTLYLVLEYTSILPIEKVLENIPGFRVHVGSVVEDTIEASLEVETPAIRVV